MPRRLRWSIAAAAFLLLWLWAYRPVLLGSADHPRPAGFVDTDFAALAQVGACLALPAEAAISERVGCLFDVSSGGGHPLAALSLALSSWTWSDAGVWRGRTPVALRIENLVLLGLAALGMRAFLRRCLLPWTGSEQAAGAGTAAAVFLCLHPLATAGVTALAARGELLALVFGTFAGAAFLRGRQEREYPVVVTAGVLVILAGLCGDLALALPLLLFLAELFCARRYKPLHARVRTAFTTAVVFGACAAVDPLLRAWRVGGLQVPRALEGVAAIDSWGDFAQAAAVAIEKLGVLVVPVGTAGAGTAGFVLAGLVVLAAIQPVLVAARSAPRLWGVLLGVWIVLVLIATLPGADVRVHVGDLSAGRLLLPAVAVLCAGLGISATALSGGRRVVLPAFVALCFGLLAHSNTVPFARAARLVRTLQDDLLEARELHGQDACILVVDPPGPVHGFDALGDALSYMLAPTFTGEDPRQPDGEAWVRGLDRRALLALARMPGAPGSELDRLRAEDLIVLLDPGELAIGADDSSAASDRRVALRLPRPPDTPGRPRPWFTSSGTSPTLDLETLGVTTVRARVSEDADTSRPPRLAWVATGLPSRDGVLAREGEVAGTWIARAGEPLAVFAVQRSLTWLLGDRVRQMRPVGGWSPYIVASEILQEDPGFDGTVVPRVEGPDWVFARPTSTSVRAVDGGGRAAGGWSLCLLDLAHYAYVEIALADGGGDAGLLVAPGAADRVNAWLRSGAGLVAWTLEYRLDGVVLASARGQRKLDG